MAISYIKLRTDVKANKKDEYPVTLYVFIPGYGDMKRGLKVSVEKKYWDEKRMQVKDTHHLAAGYNKVISEKKKRVDDYLLDCEAEGSMRTIEGVDDALAGKSRHSFFYFADKFVESKASGSYDHYLHVKGNIDEFREFCGGDLRLGSIDDEFIEKYKAFLRSKGNGHNTIKKKISTIKTPFLTAFNGGYAKKNPFHGIKLTEIETMKDVPALEHVRQLKDTDFPVGSWEFHAKNAWMFSYYMMGMRFTDVCLFKKEYLKSGRYRMNKNKKIIEYQVPEEVLKIASYYQDSPYMFPFLPREFDVNNKDPETSLKEKKAFKQAKDTANTMCNKYIKMACIKARIPIFLSMHDARSAFAEHITDLTSDVRVGQKLLAHSKIATTQKYFDKKKDRGLKEVSELFEQLRQPERQ